MERYGLADLIITTAMSGVMLFLMGFFKLGSLIRFVHVAVVIGFTNGSAVLVAVSQIKDFLGLQVDTIGSRFGGIPSALPGFARPDFSWETARFLIVPATTLALLGAIESLL